MNPSPLDLVPIDLTKARVLISNDDGIEARGLQVLEEVVRPLVGELWVSAPSEGHSGASAMVSLRREIAIEPRGERRFAVTGRPADSLLAALRITMADAPPDLVLSGINHGVNIGGDLIYSGTVGVAIAAALNRIPAIALSADHPERQPVSDATWDDVASHLPAVLEALCRRGIRRGGALGVNFPVAVSDPEPLFVRQGTSGDTMVYRPVPGNGNRYILHHEGGAPGDLDGTDLGAITAGRIGVTPLTIDRTDHALLRRIAEAN